MTHKVYFLDLHDRYFTVNVANIKTYNKDTLNRNQPLKLVKIKQEDFVTHDKQRKVQQKLNAEIE